MKKNYLLVTALVLLGYNAMMAQTARTVLVEEFTQASCPHCPPANAYLNPLLAANMGKVVAVKYQVNWPGVDTMNLQDPTDPNTRVNLYGVGNIGVPDVVLDGDTSKLSDLQAYNGYPYDLTQSLLTTEGGNPSPVSMTATYAYNSSDDSLFSTIVVKNVSGSTLRSSATGKLRLFISLLEMNIHFTIYPPGTNGEYDFYYVNRKMYPSANGFVLPDSILNGDSVVYQLHVKAPAYIYNTKEMAIAAWTQDLGGSKPVDQAVLATPANVTDNIMTDNTTYPAATEVCDVTFTPSLTLTNNGLDTLTSATVGYLIPGSTPVSQPWTGSLAPGQSTTITLAQVNAPDNTYSTLNYFVNNLNGGTLIDINDANNSPSSAFISTIPAAASLDSLSEQFEEGIQGSGFTPISTNSTDANDAFGFVADNSFLTNYIDNTSSTAACGGYAQSDASFFFCLACANAGQQDGLIFDKVDKSGHDENLLTFQHAYAGNSSANNDALDVQISTDCGNTWNTVWTKSGTALATSPAVSINTALFSPKATQWVTDSVDVSAYNHIGGVIVKFLATADGGNGLYIDNINWAEGVSSLGIHDLSSSVSANVYPNPASNLITLALNLAQTAKFDISVVNVLGQTVKVIPAGTLDQGANSIEVNVAELATGAYNFVIRSNDQVMVKRFLVTR